MSKAPFFTKTVAILHRVFLAVFYILLRMTVGLYCRIFYRIRHRVPKEVRKLRPPYMVLADHVHPMDMFFNGLGLRPVIHWVAADANFRTPFMKFVMTVLAGSIAKSKNKSDMVTLSRMRLVADVGGVVGVYHEGERSWDGVNLPSMKGTDKLVRFLKIPVVYAHLEGAYLDHPRWSWTSNRTHINIRYEIIIDRDEVMSMPLSEINRRITQAGVYDEWAYQERTRRLLHGNKRAEHIELACFTCPDCHGVNTLVSQGNDFWCSTCGLMGFVDEFGNFGWTKEPHSWPGGRAFRTVRDWNLWQIEHFGRQVDGLHRGMEEGTLDPSQHLFWEDLGTVHLNRGKRTKRMTDLGIGTARLFGDRIEFESDEISLVWPLESVSSFSVFKQLYTEFYFEKQLHRFTFTRRSVSGYKWLLLFRLLSKDPRSGYSLKSDSSELIRSS